MCLTTRWKFPRITTKEKVVYKIVIKSCVDKTVCYAGVTKFRYKYNILHKESIFKHLLVNRFSSTLNEFKDGWVHSFDTLETTIDNKQFYSCPPRCALAVVKCIIPKFTLYYKGMNGDICSKKIIIKKDIK